MRKKKTKKTKKTKVKKGDGGKALRKLFSPEPWKIKASATKRGAFTAEFRKRLDERMLTVFGTYPSVEARLAKTMIEHSYHTLFGML